MRSKIQNIVVHLATISNHLAPFKRHYEITVLGTLNLVKLVGKYGQKFIYLSSMAVKARDFTNYSIAKRLQDKVVGENLEDFVAIRPSFIYDRQRLLKAFNLPMIPRDVLVNPVYVQTVIEAIERAFRRGKGIYELGDARPVKLSKLVEAVRGKPPQCFPARL